MWTIAPIGNWLWRGFEWSANKMQIADIADTLQLRDVVMAVIFVFQYMGCILAPSGEYDWTVHV